MKQRTNDKRFGPKCSKCRKYRAEFDSPAHLCGRCWAKWWVDGLEPRSPGERRRLMREVMKTVNQSGDTR